MSFHVRPARPEDIARIIPWTTDTFEWGDYVPDRLPGWLDDPESHVVVCVDDSDHPVAVEHTVMLSPTEAWLEAARVHPDFRRQGMGSAMNRAGTTWAAGEGARVARLAVEAVNVPSRRQVESLGYRHTSTWVAARLDPAHAAPIDDRDRLRPSPTADVEAAWMSWGLSELARVGQELISEGWRFRNASLDDLARAAGRSELLQSSAGWIMVSRADPDRIRSGWMSTTVHEAPVLVAALMDHAARAGVGEVRMFAPAVPWMVETLARAGGEPTETWIYTLPL